MTKQFLTFRLDNNQYAVEVHKVQEVLEYIWDNEWAWI